jgi:hypothetical protein
MLIGFRHSLLVLAATAGALARPAVVPHGTAVARANWRDSVRALAEQHFNHSAWGASHSRRDYALARALAESDHLTYDDDVLYAAAYLHDIAGFAPWMKAGVDHQDRGAELMDSVLAGIGFPHDKIEKVKAAIRTHMYGRDPGSAVESRLLHDADSLDWLGAVGIARVMSLVDANGGKPDFAAVVKELREFLDKVPPSLTTEAAKREGVRRAAETRAFLESLESQTKGLADL